MIALFTLLGQLAWAGPETTVRSVADVEWTALNPARGAASPRAGTLWGDRTAGGPSGFLVRFADGFSSPPHIHNVTYRAVVIAGEVHNDDAGAAPMWMTPGSFWTQPQAEAHITSSRGDSMAYVEIDDGPYLVHPADQAKTVHDKPINVDASNLVWTASGVDGVAIARLWGAPDDGAGGVMLRLDAEAGVQIRSRAPVRAVVVAGTPAGASASDLAPGSLLSGRVVDLRGGTGPSTFYLRTDAGLSLTPVRRR